MYWAVECDECTQLLLNYFATKLNAAKTIARKYAEEADRRARSGEVSCSHEQMSCDSELSEVKL